MNAMFTNVMFTNAVSMNASILKRGIATVAFSALLAMTVSCGSDSNPLSENGSLTDPSFVEVQGQVDAFLDSVFVAFSAGLSSYNEVPITDGQIRLFYGPGFPGGANQSTYEYTAEGWHHITSVFSNESIVLGVNDSIQFRNNTIVQQSATDADVLDYRHHWAVTQIDQSADFANFSGDVSYVFSNLSGASATINGSYGYEVSQRTIDVNSAVTDDSFTFESSTSNVSIAQPTGGVWATGCPSNGSVTFSLAQIKIVTNGSVVDTSTIAWTGSTTFSEGVATVSLSDGTTNWVYSNSVCSPAQ